MTKRTNAEIQKLPRKDGCITISQVIEFARSHPKSALHREIEWNDAKAAEAFRHVQAAALIEELPNFFSAASLNY